MLLQMQSQLLSRKIASELGCTPMKVYEMVEKEGRSGFVMDFINGVSQNDMPSKNPLYACDSLSLHDTHVSIESTAKADKKKYLTDFFIAFISFPSVNFLVYFHYTFFHVFRVAIFREKIATFVHLNSF